MIHMKFGIHFRRLLTIAGASLVRHWSARWFATGPLIGSTIGSPPIMQWVAAPPSVGGEFADLYGRKTSLVLIMALYAVGGVALTLGNAALESLALVVAARFACGVAAGATTVVLPVYLGEVRDDCHIRSGALND